MTDCSQKVFEFQGLSRRKSCDWQRLVGRPRRARAAAAFGSRTARMAATCMRCCHTLASVLR